MSTKASKKKDYLISLIEIALKYWIRSQCNSIEDIYINIKGDALNIINGKISGLSVKGNRIDFKGLLIQSISINSEEITLEVGISLKGVKAIPIKDFKIKGNIVLSSKDLNTILSAPTWSWIANWLCSNFCNNANFAELKINQNELILKSYINEIQSTNINYLFLEAKDGTILFKDKESLREALLPMDNSICINNINLKESILTIDGSSSISP